MNHLWSELVCVDLGYSDAPVCGYVLTFHTSCRMRRPIGRLTVQEQKLEGEFRYVNSRLITNSEEIAFYQGNKKEKKIIMAAFDKLVSITKHNNNRRPGIDHELLLVSFQCV